MDAPIGAFLTTRWSIVDGVRSGDPARASEALARLTELYWPAVYTYLRRRGVLAEEAEELTQSFFAEVVVGRKLFSSAFPDRGRLRSLILTALRNYSHDVARRTAGRGRDRPQTIRMSADFGAEEQLVAVCEGTPEDGFDRRWAVALLTESLRRCELHFRECGKSGHWALFDARVLRPAITSREALPLAFEHEARDFDSRADAAAAVQTVKRRFHAVLRDVIAESIAAGEDLDAEVADVIRILQSRFPSA